MAHSVPDLRIGARVAMRPSSGRRAEQRARRHILRELDRRILQRAQPKPDEP
ncbi:MAG TPA: hypothetical protein VEY05_06840 [Beijerinckiaceae bacterium]|jgi:hypothetical protein|nr:hypothetical protein [Beijerinckiaceae bacterium]